MVKAVWNGAVVAESDDVVEVDGYTYFPKDTVRAEFLRDSPRRSTCHWKGEASYYTLEVDGETNESAAWYYAEPSDEASMVRDRVGFWRGVRIEK